MHTSSQCIGGASQNGGMEEPRAAAVDLYWLPLGAGGRSVRLNGRVFEWIEARRARREPRDLYHSALEVRLGDGRFVVEMTPASRTQAAHGVVARGTVAVRAPLVRYEVRCWRGGTIPDLDKAVESPRRLTEDARAARRILELAPEVPCPVWGRDGLGAGEMWNSNSVISWLVQRSGLDAAGIALPAGGRAPGWNAGIVVARREPDASSQNLAPETR